MRPVKIPGIDALLVATVFAVPLFVPPDCRDGYVVPKEALFEMLTWALLWAWLWRHLCAHDLASSLRALMRRPIAVPLAAYVLTSALSLVFGSVEYVPWRGALLGLASVVFLLILLERLDANPALAAWIAAAYVVAITITAIVVVNQDWHPDPATLESMRASLSGARPDWRFALVGTAGNPNFAASGFILALPIALCGSLFARRGRFLLLLSAIILGAALLATFSAAGLLGAALALLVLAAWMAIRRPGARAWPAALAGVLLLSFYLAPNPWNARGESYLSAARESPLWAHGYLPRIFIWQTTALMIRDHPVFGVGYGGYFPEHQKYQGLHYRLRGTPHELPRVGMVDYAHSVPLQRAAETGLPGLLALLWMLVVVGRAFMCTWSHPTPDWLRVAAGLALLAVCAQALPDDPLYSLVGRMGMLVCAALVLRRDEAPAVVSGPPRRARSPAATRIVLGAACAVIALLSAYRLAWPILAERAAAAADYAAAAGYNPQDPVFRHGYANLLASRGLYVRARDELKKSYRLLPGADVAASWERLSLRLGDLPDAIAARRAMLAVNPCYGPWYGPLADLLERTGDAAGAEEARALARRFSLSSP